MSKLNIPIQADEDADEEFVVERAESEPSFTEARSVPQAAQSSDSAKHMRFVTLMMTALENPAGIRIRRPSHSEAVALRHRLYRARQWYRNQGYSSLEKLIIRIETKGFSHYVYIQPELPLELEIL